MVDDWHWWIARIPSWIGASLKIETHRAWLLRVREHCHKNRKGTLKSGREGTNFEREIKNGLSSTNIEAHCCWKTVQPARHTWIPSPWTRVYYTSSWSTWSAIFERSKSHTEDSIAVWLLLHNMEMEVIESMDDANRVASRCERCGSSYDATFVRLAEIQVQGERPIGGGFKFRPDEGSQIR
jgi:hypothetical protein